jgi:hypothetical protein
VTIPGRPRRFDGAVRTWGAGSAPGVVRLASRVAIQLYEGDGEAAHGSCSASGGVAAVVARLLMLRPHARRPRHRGSRRRHGSPAARPAARQTLSSDVHGADRSAVGPALADPIRAAVAHLGGDRVRSRALLTAPNGPPAATGWGCWRGHRPAARPADRRCAGTGPGDRADAAMTAGASRPGDWPRCWSPASLAERPARLQRLMTGRRWWAPGRP